MSGISFDVKLSRSHDLTSEDGCRSLLRYLMRLFTNGVAIAAPPCSLYSCACASVHKRTKENVRGDLGNWKVRLARVIWTNWVTCMKILHSLRPDVWLICEQPSTSWGFCQPEFVQLAELMGMFLTFKYIQFIYHLDQLINLYQFI
ncbi:unnamed protein product [Cladocopium goreaui]|uniref:Uncharacterized protein n=1 Tax=Cladocopium goreaui TaxID=2562237 RepID=A0A9P1D4C7_9DINO|nr:unnamed protein product [Cladocopium goreaui]CAI3983876.1 unnamed protein product [Cladocopium goreaui]CAI4003603.1 unnamed protein product [Cladocopium goreaui]CAI4008821.1 unnamed protein product [Cladocopium goreaui]